MAEALARDAEARLQRAQARSTADGAHASDDRRARPSARTFKVTELQCFADCSSSLVRRAVPRAEPVDAEPDAKLRGQVAHRALHKFFTPVCPQELGDERVEPRPSRPRRCMRGVPRRGARGGYGWSSTEMQAPSRPVALARLEAVVADECESQLGARSARVRGRVRDRARGTRAAARPRARHGLTLSGKIDRIDRPVRRRGIVQDYKSGKHAHSAAPDQRELRSRSALHARPARPRRPRATRRGLPAAGRRSARARGLLPRQARGETLKATAGDPRGRRGTGVPALRRLRAPIRDPCARSGSGPARRRPGMIPRGGEGADVAVDLGPMCR